MMDFASVKHNEDNKVFVDQTNITGQVNKQVENRLNTVQKGDDTSNEQKKFDAREKGSNEYAGDGGRKKEKKETGAEERVIFKGATSSFDIRI